ncbi:MAG: hypothetical protein K9L95_02515 [Candidatus Omnitrophica bacterium]|nr:hypothetical protein [Candidatus Omnitrophota bacterium]MCF7878329.1 hypothetical protein [Candidatus Omnitrophota bacterium]
MAKKKGTPEEELLSLIERDSDSDIASARVKRKRKSFFHSIFNFKKHWRFLFGIVKKIYLKLAKTANESGIKFFNKVLVLIIFLLAIYLSVDFILQRENIDNVYKTKVVPDKQLWEENGKTKTLPLLYYLEMVQRRNVFSPFKLEPKAEKMKKKKESLAKLTKGLNLVGISLGKNPYAMIEDQETGKTYFLNKGDKIRNLKLHSILKNKVILIYEGAKIDLM